LNETSFIFLLFLEERAADMVTGRGKDGVEKGERYIYRTL
jgi:hypothetical protein